MADKTISIYDEEFTVSAPYEAGYSINEHEAKALNQVRAENIANNFRAKIKTAKESNDPQAMAVIRTEFAEYDNQYQFTAAGVRSRSATVNPLEKEALSIARTYVLGKVKERTGLTLKAYLAADPANQAKFDANVETVAQSDAVIKLAKKRLKEKSEIANLELGEQAAA